MSIVAGVVPLVLYNIFMFARNAKEDFDSDDWERKRAVIKRLGADLKLTNRTIRFTSVKYLVPVAEKYPELKEQFELARTDSEQMKKGPGVGLISQWYTGRDSGFAKANPQRWASPR